MQQLRGQLQADARPFDESRIDPLEAGAGSQADDPALDHDFSIGRLRLAVDSCASER